MEFVKRLEASIDRVGKRLEAYLWDQNPENTHDVRTGIRRMQASFNLLPRSIRKGKRVDDYMDSCMTFFRISTKSRDIDTILNLIQNYEVPDDSSTSSVISNLTKDRASLLKDARKGALSFQESTKPYFKSSELSKKKIVRRFEKQTQKLATRINAKASEVLEGYASSSEDLHMLRKDCKKLRYMIELVQNPRSESKVLKKLSEWQDVLGHLHDLDVTIEFLKKLSSPKEIKWSEPILVKLLEERRKSLDQMIMTSKKESTWPMVEPVKA